MLEGERQQLTPTLLADAWHKDLVPFRGGQLFVAAGPQSISVTWWQNVDRPHAGTANACAGDMLLGNGDWYVNRVIVKPEGFRSKGLGGALLDRLKEEVAKCGAKRLLVEPGGYGSAPHRLQKFYRSHGFKRHREGYYFWECS
jgi:ribosomal protein S18 acetylase RimI-like enzyme